jgi:hypothetical protein
MKADEALMPDLSVPESASVHGSTSCLKYSLGGVVKLLQGNTARCCRPASRKKRIIPVKNVGSISHYVLVVKAFISFSF